MSKLKLTQAEIDGLVNVERVVVRPTVYGVGFNDVGFQPSIDGKHVWQYKLWKNMLERSFSDKLKLRRPSYQDVTVCDEWLYFGNFIEWVNKEVDYKGKPIDTDLDKDIIVKGNKIYSPEACSFVPRNVNMLLNDHGAARGDWPVGVYYKKSSGCFVALLSTQGRRKHLGHYSTPEDAFAAYKVAKEAQIKVVALQHKGVLKPAVFESLMSWEINHDD